MNKEIKLYIISKTNPAPDNIHTWIRSVKDIYDFEELELGDQAPDYTKEMMEEALRTRKIKVYSSYQIENGVFITPSKMEAKNYSGNKEPFEIEVCVDDIAWIDGIEGQYTKITDKWIKEYNDKDK